MDDFPVLHNWMSHGHRVNWDVDLDIEKTRFRSDVVKNEMMKWKRLPFGGTFTVASFPIFHNC